MLLHNTTPSLSDLYRRLEQLNSAIVALEEIQQARARREHPLAVLRGRRRTRLLHFHRSSKKPECVTSPLPIAMSA
jgi:hypothetical protein